MTGVFNGLIIVGIPLLIWLAYSRNRKIDHNDEFNRNFEKNRR